ncbi:MAG: tRNA pseudouridine(55) synthase TruB [Pseudomonadales bacterium]
MANRRKKGRLIDGIFLLDKPLELSSNHALQRVKRAFGAQKAGHTGSLDPLATGMLPICLGEATKFSQYMLDADKTYRATAKLGIRTGSGDVDSEIISERPVPELDREAVEAALMSFLGDTMQVPSMYSALKQNGQPLYKLARQGIEVERKARPIHIFDIKLLDIRGDELDIELQCSKGTYVRNLVDDLGELLGCGAHVITLRRLSVRGFDEAAMVTLEELQAMAAAPGEGAGESEQVFETLDALLLPAWEAVKELPKVELNDLAASYLKQGQPVFVPNVTGAGKVVLFNKDADTAKSFVGIGEVMDDGRIAPSRLISTE